MATSTRRLPSFGRDEPDPAEAAAPRWSRLVMTAMGAMALVTLVVWSATLATWVWAEQRPTIQTSPVSGLRPAPDEADGDRAEPAPRLAVLRPSAPATDERTAPAPQPPAETSAPTPEPQAADAGPVVAAPPEPEAEAAVAVAERMDVVEEDAAADAPPPAPVPQPAEPAESIAPEPTPAPAQAQEESAPEPAVRSIWITSADPAAARGLLGVELSPRWEPDLDRAPVAQVDAINAQSDLAGVLCPGDVIIEVGGAPIEGVTQERIVRWFEQRVFEDARLEVLLIPHEAVERRPALVRVAGDAPQAAPGDDVRAVRACAAALRP